MTDHSGEKYWRSLRELQESGPVDELKAQEFMQGVTDGFSPDALPALSRKKFLALLTASAAFAAAGCTNYRDKGEIVPYTRKPEEITPGVANLYASTCTLCPQACGLLVKTREGRPVKLDGNPDHPANRGALCARGQAGILGLYDPARLRRPTRGSSSGLTGDVGWNQADAEIRKQLGACTRNGREIALVTPPISSPTFRDLVRRFAERYPTTRVYSCELLHDRTRRAAWERCYGTDAMPAVRWEEAEAIVALESDFLGTEGETVETTRRFAAGRNVVGGGTLNRLYAVEGTMSLTGANADYRLRLRPDAQYEFVLALLNEISARQAAGLDENAARIAAGLSLAQLASRHDLPAETLGFLVKDLLEGRSMVRAGSTLPEEVHVAVHYLNELIGAAALYDPAAARVSGAGLTGDAEFASLVERMGKREVGVVIHAGANPVFHLPRLLGYAAALRSVPLSVSLAEAEDETGALCTYVLPVHTMLESWGDHHVRADVISLQQPVVAPLYDTRQKEAVLLSWIGEGGDFRESLYHEYLKARWEKEVHPVFGRSVSFASFWHGCLHDGVLPVPEGPPRPRATFRKEALATLPAVTEAPSGFVLALKGSHFTGDGSLANNGWLQEIPHPVSKVVWDNYAALSPASAAELGVGTSDLITIRTNHGTQTLPVFVQPGQADRCITAELGYGRWNAGPIGTGVGTDVMPLMPPAGLSGTRIIPVSSVEKAEGRHPIVSTQEHHALDDAFVKDLHLKRRIIREGTLRQYRADPRFLHHHAPKLFSISKEVEYHGVKWAMAIDLNRCTGCNACVSGCNVENNIPVVGKDQVDHGREMQWIRIDRYYAGEPDAPRLSHQPMLCQHCDQAPCENVCPVVATTHSPDGLNQMTYNRCVGTKYCSNNCPYKVRRFNFYDFRDRLADGYYEQEPAGLVHNPEVTVRSRGVMEKCTFCIQRIMEARQHAVEQGRAIRAADVKTACQEACPAQAIVFGDMNDPASEVSRLRAHNLGYYVIEEVNARPNVTYLARLRNTHTEDLA